MCLGMSNLSVHSQKMTRVREIREEGYKRDANKYEIYQLLCNEEYIKVVNMIKPKVDGCRQLEWLCQDEYLFLIDAYLGINYIDSALFYANILSEKIKNYDAKLYHGNMNDIYDYFIIYNVASNEQIQSILKQAYKSYFFRQQYPLEAVGIHFFDFYYEDQRTVAHYYQQISDAKDTLEILKANEERIKIYEGFTERFYALYNNHQWLYTTSEIGEVSSMQDILLFHEGDPHLFETYVLPILNNSYKKGLIDGCEMERQLTTYLCRKYHIPSLPMKKQISDSLLTIFSCESVIIYHEAE